MTARVFRGMDRVFLRAFAPVEDSGTALWQRNGVAQPDRIRVIFNRAYVEIAADGMRVDDGAPTAWVSLADARRLAPGRSDDVLFDNDDAMVIGGTTYRVESCRPDGRQMVEVRLSQRDV
jgi:hypothetical protein